MESAAGGSADDDVWDQEQDDLGSERAIAAQSLAKLERTLSSIGYRNGIDASKSEHMQEGFDDGFAGALEHGRSLGLLLGELTAHRLVCQRLDRTPCVPDLDSLIARLRAFGHSVAFNMDAVRDASAPGADAHSPTTEAFKALADEAASAVRALESQHP
ncbi:hypothetical protein LPJ61_002097 [Coemansia biformis]|uniref:Protein YAE1 n=1 Tax=Coemansia biformis TaxID=1286918 RepID=A0A9W8CYZ5_9FUNG|nr:hypothetical protein LPJ61_002097 [Coemansia biformis]